MSMITYEESASTVKDASTCRGKVSTKKEARLIVGRVKVWLHWWKSHVITCKKCTKKTTHKPSYMSSKSDCVGGYAISIETNVVCSAMQFS